MLSTLILAVVIGQAPQPGWFSITNRPGWEGYGTPNGNELTPEKWRKVGKPETEWVPETKKVVVEQTEWVPTTVRVEKVSAVREQPVQQPASSPVVPVFDTYGFTVWLNNTRAAYGLQAVGYDQNLSNWAAMNNGQQQARGLGHYVMGPARRQNSAWGGAFPGSSWMASSPHRAALLDPTISWIGIAFSGAYWTFSAY